MGNVTGTARNKIDNACLRRLREDLDKELKAFDERNLNARPEELQRIRKEIKDVYRMRVERRWYFRFVRSKWDAEVRANESETNQPAEEIQPVPPATPPQPSTSQASK